MPTTASDPIVLVENERTLDASHESWQDITGVQYHYPNTYTGRVIEGRRFIYYRGVRRPNGVRGSAEYFGAGRIGSVWPDPANTTLPKLKWKWFCSIEDYQPFVRMVPSKVGSSYYERVSNPRDWGIGVRPIPETTYERIVSAGGATPFITSSAPALPQVDLVNPVESDQLLVAIPRKSTAAGTATSTPPRRSPAARAYGRRAEEVVLRFLEAKRPRLSKLRWVSDEKEQPGWDIEYFDQARCIAVEVKGTSADRFVSVDLTANEWRAAEQLRERFWLYLVARCTSLAPQIQTIQDPWGLLQQGKIDAEPVVWRLRLLA
jgi:Domain of unknown function (DUF3883)